MLACATLLAGGVLADEPGFSPGVVAEGAELVRIASGLSFAEGPAADADGNVYFTDQPNNRILRWSADGGLSVFMQDAGRANGLYVDSAGHLLACADENNQLWRISSDKEVTVLVADVDGARLNGPNDLWVSADGGIWFTDPYYQREYWSRRAPDLESENVYYLSPGGELAVVEDSLVRPNGIVGSAAGDRLYVADAGAGRTYVYEIGEGGALEAKREFAPMGSDGMTIDNKGNVYLTGDGVTVFDATGEKIQHIPVDERWTANVTFGGRDHDTLFITASGSVYMLRMAVKGARW